jgi:hypothetical protein
MLELKIKTADEIHADAQQKQEYKYVGSKRHIPGLKLWELNIENFEIKEVEIVKTVAIGTDKKPVFTKKANYNPKHLYCQALNLKNAEKKFEKIIKSILECKS